MSLEIWLVYFFATMALCVTPGPNSLLVLTHGASHGLKKSLFTSMGGAAGFTLVIGVCMAGLGAVLAASTLAFDIVKWIGAGYLIYLGIITWRSPPLKAQFRATPTKAKGRILFAQGFMAAASNPKVIIFFAAFLPQFVDPERSQFIQFLFLAATFVSTEFVVEILLAGSASKLAPWLAKSNVGRWFNRISGGTFIAIGGLLALTEK
ncbi:MAG: LysE family translocator [Sneathiella sp.]